MRRRCPICRSTKYYRINRVEPKTGKVMPLNDCKKCRYRWSDRSQTIFRGSHLPQEKIDLMLSMLESDPETTCLKLAAMARVQYKTAWVFKRRVLEGPGLAKGYSQGKNRVGRHRTRKECAGLAP